MLQGDAQLSKAAKEAILLKKRDWLTNLVQRAGTEIDVRGQQTQVINSVVDWLMELFG